MCLSIMMVNVSTQFMKKVSNTEAELKERVAYKKACNKGAVFFLLTVKKSFFTDNKKRHASLNLAFQGNVKSIFR